MTDAAKEINPYRIFSSGLPVDADFRAEVIAMPHNDDEPSTDTMKSEKPKAAAPD